MRRHTWGWFGLRPVMLGQFINQLMTTLILWHAEIYKGNNKRRAHWYGPARMESDQLLHASDAKAGAPVVSLR